MDNRLNVLMQDTALRKAFGARVKELRKSRDWSQKQLATQLDIRFQLLNKYEGGQHIPPAETLIKLADTLKTTVDYLLTGNPQQEHPNVDDVNNPITAVRSRLFEPNTHRNPAFQPDANSAYMQLL